MIDCVFGGTPSQGFTNMGQRDSNDPRNGLVGEFFRLVCELGPRSFVFDNVKGITGGVHKKFLDQQIKLLEAEGYHVRKGFKVLNAQHFGVPQSREHFFLFGVKSGEELPNYPSPKFQAAGRPSMACDAPNGPTVQDAIGDLPDVEQFDTLCRSDQVEVSNWGVRSSYAASLRCEDHADWHFGYQREWDPNLLTSSARTEHNVVSRQRFSQTPVGKVEPISRFFKLDPAGVANTLRAGTDAARGAFSSPRPIHYAHPRCITVREMARLHGFPDWFRFHATKWHGARQVGLAVPPPLARAVATEVIKVLGFKPSEAKVTLPAPETTALGFNGTAAAQRYGVAQPIAKRQRKSAATEIKQGETGSAVGAK
jgi:DNA (cytosine-5)-methyltransferase 1